MNTEEIKHLSKLSSLEFHPAEAASVAADLEAVFVLASQLQAINTSGVEPLFHPIAMIRELSQVLRPDEVTEHDTRDANMQSSPASFQGLFLVPKVIE